VRLSYEQPVETFTTNAVGTMNLLEGVRALKLPSALVLITTDKCYENNEWIWPYRETDSLGGYDPYSSSKACAEIVSAAYRQSYFPVAELGKSHQVALATARAGNVIGGGDWSTDRLLPDLVRGFQSGEPVLIRAPRSIRPWQHVLEPLRGYIRLAEKLLTHDIRYATAYNFGPTEEDARTVSWIADRMSERWADGASWVLDENPSLHEASYLKLDASRARADLGWMPCMKLDVALEFLVDWYKRCDAASDMHTFTVEQIKSYTRMCHEGDQ